MLCAVIILIVCLVMLSSLSNLLQKATIFIVGWAIHEGKGYSTIVSGGDVRCHWLYTYFAPISGWSLPKPLIRYSNDKELTSSHHQDFRNNYMGCLRYLEQ